MRSHGWAGNTPASDEEAIERILDAADKIIDERGPTTRIADVARALGVTRQTVYRYFPGTQALLVAAAMRSADGFLDRLASHLHGVTDPVVAMTEGMAFAIEQLASDNQVEFVLDRRHRGDRAVRPAAATISGGISPAGSGPRSPTRSWCARWTRSGARPPCRLGGARRKRPDDCARRSLQPSG